MKIPKNLIPLNPNEIDARKIINEGIAGKIKIHVMNSNTSKFQLLTKGQLQSIYSHHPKKVLISMEKPELGFINGKLSDISHKQAIDCLDLWVNKTFLSKLESMRKIDEKSKNKTKKDHGNNLEAINVEKIASESPALQHLLHLTIEAKKRFPDWADKQKKIKKTGNLMDWLIKDIKANDREAYFILKVLSESFKEIK